MAVLLGIAGNSIVANDATTSQESAVMQMVQLVQRTHRNVTEEIYKQDGVTATRVFNRVYENDMAPEPSDVALWIDGHLGETKDPAKYVVEQYDRQADFSFLRDQRGVYAFVLFDAKRRQLHLVCCPSGIRHLHYAVAGNKLVWSSEVKGFLGVPNFEPHIDELAVLEFINVGQLLGNRTWFENVKHVPAGSVVTWHCDSNRLETRRFWDWDYSPSHNSDINVLVDELGDHFTRAVERAFDGPGRKGITLSGGLDSRAILAVANQLGPIDAVTFGEAESVDMRYAALAANVSKGTRHHTHSLTNDNWLAERLYGSWITDGSLNLLHNHAFPVWRKTSELFDIHVQSFAGDVWMGGSFLTQDFVNDPRPSSHTRMLSQKLGFRPVWEPERFHDHFAEFASQYCDTEQFFLNNRLRRFTVYGSYFIETYIQDRKPTLEKDLFDFCFSIPGSLRHDSAIYNRMLIRRFPDYYRKIPWAKTGYPISYPRSVVRLGGLAKRVQNKLMTLLGLPPSVAAMANYTLLARQEPGRSVFTSLLDSKDMLLTQWIPKPTINRILQAYLEGKGDADECCRLLTLELWLQQVFNQRFRSLDAEREELEKLNI